MQQKQSIGRWAVRFTVIMIATPIIAGLAIVAVSLLAKALGFIA